LPIIAFLAEQYLTRPATTVNLAHPARIGHPVARKWPEPSRGGARKLRTPEESGRCHNRRGSTHRGLQAERFFNMLRTQHSVRLLARRACLWEAGLTGNRDSGPAELEEDARVLDEVRRILERRERIAPSVEDHPSRHSTDVQSWLLNLANALARDVQLWTRSNTGRGSPRPLPLGPELHRLVYSCLCAHGFTLEPAEVERRITIWARQQFGRDDLAEASKDLLKAMRFSERDLALRLVGGIDLFEQAAASSASTLYARQRAYRAAAQRKVKHEELCYFTLVCLGAPTPVARVLAALVHAVATGRGGADQKALLRNLSDALDISRSPASGLPELAFKERDDATRRR
jgi:hypothetical protein